MRPGSSQRTVKMIRSTLYTLKRRFGFPIEVCLESPQSYDPATGDAIVTYEKNTIRRAIVFPGMVHRDIFYSITFLRANSNFAYGADIQNDDRSLIIDGKDLPKGFILTDKYYYIFNNERWDMQDFTRLEDGLSYFINIRRSKNAPTQEVHEAKLLDNSTLTESFTPDT